MSVAYAKFDLTGRTAVVTGGCRGLGYYMARGLARSGATVMITARTEADLKQAAEALSAESDGNEILYHPVDLAVPAETAAMAEHALQRMGRVDILVGNAGQANFQPVDGLTEDSVDHTMIPMRRQGRPEEIEGTAQLLASEAGSYINAANLVIDGGFTVALHPLTPL